MTAASLLVRPPADSAHQPRTSIVQVEQLRSTGSREGPWERLERHKPKGLRVVLRGLGSSNAPRLPGLGSSNAPRLPGLGSSNASPLPDYRKPFTAPAGQGDLATYAGTPVTYREGEAVPVELDGAVVGHLDVNEIFA